MKFTKMHGLGNDYVYVNAFDETVADPAAMAVAVSRPHFGVGADGLVLIGPSAEADFAMRMFNADGSEGEMCGNAVRCIGKYVHDRGLTRKTEVRLSTLGGIKTLQLRLKDGSVDQVTVDMGEPAFSPASLPVEWPGERIVNQPLTIDGQTHHITCVSMGNPHAVIFVDDPKAIDVHGIGRQIENHPLFPRRTNVEFVRVRRRDLLEMRVWERGSGETLACGTGAAASLVAAVLNGLADRSAVVQLTGGDLQVTWDSSDNHVYQTGPASFVFDGVWLGD
ncbi:MAG TPA: diaminopimelate epimerase [Ottowia sp.]|uniref:diaminopimelate epimerase n=1 Tax=Ottowia sp. TaxID=1898956 RepID=UPI0011D858FD|nr:diaminopimelate epimerase [Ottowia sp.]MCZ2088339.1 diaminopimelate epimerase [Burkholderiales bacterium]TXI22445.1 MAG: diaminopimelate epimerase [Ottowia sp.]HNE60818.1 diaminopimelate epimerase [Ottowia sp.]HNI84014.1 diaminopimelate epimerase [Ottowia sp.]HNJ44508.1 diaminopimelate epimerase [Ottowia sp.]